MNGNVGMAVFYGITSVLLSSWPFIGALYIPLALDVLRTHGLRHAIALGVRNILLVVTPILLIDRYYYQKFVLPPWCVAAQPKPTQIIALTPSHNRTSTLHDSIHRCSTVTLPNFQVSTRSQCI